MKSTKQRDDEYVPVPGVANPQLFVGDTTFAVAVEEALALGTAFTVKFKKVSANIHLTLDTLAADTHAVVASTEPYTIGET